MKDIDSFGIVETNAMTESFKEALAVVGEEWGIVRNQSEDNSDRDTNLNRLEKKYVGRSSDFHAQTIDACKGSE